MTLNTLLENKRVLITGGAGFIGSHLAEHLAPTNSVTILDDLSIGKLENIKTFQKDVKFVEGSILDIPLLKEILRDVDIVFHEAAMASVEESMKDPHKTHEVNATGTLNLLRVARDCKVERFVFASTCAVYGDLPGLPKNEDMKLDPKSPYAASKIVGELYCKIFTEVYGLPTVVLRYFNVFGPRQDPKSHYASVIPKFVDLMLQDKNPIIYGDGTQTRDFIFVENIVSGTELAAHATNVQGEVFNIACSAQISVNSLLEAINDILGKDIKPVYDDPRPGDIKYSQADISKAKRLLGYKELVGFKEGLRRTIEYFS